MEPRLYLIRSGKLRRKLRNMPQESRRDWLLALDAAAWRTQCECYFLCVSHIGVFYALVFSFKCSAAFFKSA